MASPIKAKDADAERGKMFIGGLSWETTLDGLKNYFARFGEVTDCVVMKHPETGRSRGFGFITFADPDNVDLVLQSGPHQLDGRTIDPKPCNPRSGPAHKGRRNLNGYKVFLGGLPANLTETDIRNFFSQYGKVTEVVIMYDQEKKRSRGFGFLSFESEESVDRCVSEHYVNINGKQVEVKRAEPRDSRGSGNNGPNKGYGGWDGPGMGMQGGPMGGPMGGGMMGGGYQGWGGPGGPGYGYGPQGGYPGWGGPSGQWSGYGAPGGNYGYGPQGQQSGYGNWGGWNGPAGGPSGPGPAAPGTESYGRGSSGANGPAGSAASAGGPQAGGPAAKGSEGQQYGGYGSYGYGDPNQGYRGYGSQDGAGSGYGYGSGEGAQPAAAGSKGPTGGPAMNGAAGPGPQRASTYTQPQQNQGYHPYRR